MYMNAYEMKEGVVYRVYDKGSFSPVKSIDYNKAQAQYEKWAALERAEREVRHWEKTVRL